MLVEFAWRNPAAWLWLNLLLVAHRPGCLRFDRAVRGTLPAAPQAPIEVRIGARRLTLRWIDGGPPGAADGAPSGLGPDAGAIVDLPAGAPGSTLAMQVVRLLAQALHRPPASAVPTRWGSTGGSRSPAGSAWCARTRRSGAGLPGRCRRRRIDLAQ